MREQMGPAMDRIAAKAVLKLRDGHPLRDVETARARLLAKLELDRAEPTADAFGANGRRAARFPPALARGLRGADRGGVGRLHAMEDPGDRREFLGGAIGYFTGAAIEARDADDPDGERAWLARARPLVDALPAASGNGLVIGLVLALGGQDEAAADAFASVVDAASPADPAGLVAAMHEARIRVRRDAFERGRRDPRAAARGVRRELRHRGHRRRHPGRRLAADRRLREPHDRRGRVAALGDRDPARSSSPRACASATARRCGGPQRPPAAASGGRPPPGGARRRLRRAGGAAQPRLPRRHVDAPRPAARGLPRRAAAARRAGAPRAVGGGDRRPRYAPARSRSCSA